MNGTDDVATCEVRALTYSGGVGGVRTICSPMSDGILNLGLRRPVLPEDGSLGNNVNPSAPGGVTGVIRSLGPCRWLKTPVDVTVHLTPVGVLGVLMPRVATTVCPVLMPSATGRVTTRVANPYAFG